MAPPGVLPFPDRDRDGNYDGRGDCVTFGLRDRHLLGRFPWRGDAAPCPTRPLGADPRGIEGGGLWYAVSRNLLARGRGGPLNPRTGEPGRAAYPWLTVRDRDGHTVTRPGTGEPLAVGAVIIAPGAALEHQNRSGPTPGAGAFLDSRAAATGRVDNADSDGCPDHRAPPCALAHAGEEFIMNDGARDDGFNDRLTYLGVDVLMRAVEKRALGEAAAALRRYRDAFGAYPWLIAFRDPDSLRGASRIPLASRRARRGLLAVHGPGERFSTGFHGAWRFMDSSPASPVAHTGNPALVPPLGSVLSGVVRVAAEAGRCAWSEPTRAHCEGSWIDPAHYRADLGAHVRRTVEVRFSFTDAAPRVQAPAPADVRRRWLTVSADPLPATPAWRWNVRVTDDDGLDRASRELAIDADTAGAITLGGIRYDLSVVYDGVHDGRDELPEWFVINEWHHFVHAAFSADAVAGGDADGDGDCRTPVDTCLSLRAAGRPVGRGVRALVIAPGAALPAQDRVVGDCDGDRVPDDFLCAYLEGENADRSTPARADGFVRGALGRGFNDQVLIVEVQ